MGQGSLMSKMYTTRKKKDKQQKYKKFKYHQYVPPDQVKNNCLVCLIGY